MAHSLLHAEAVPEAQVKGALDPNMQDILSAYSPEQGVPALPHTPACAQLMLLMWALAKCADADVSLLCLLHGV